MSFAHLPEASRATHPNTYQGATALPSAPFNMAQRRVYPSLYPLPGASRPPLASPPDATYPTFSSSVPVAYGARGIYNMPNQQDHHTHHFQTGFIPSMQGPVPSMNNTNLSATRYPFPDASPGNAIGTTAPLTEQPYPFTFQFPLPTQPEAVLDQRQVQHLQHDTQRAREDFAVEESVQQTADVHREEYQTNEESHVPLVSSGVDPCSGQDNQADGSGDNIVFHICSDNSLTTCSGCGAICLDILSLFIKERPDVLSPEQIAELVFTSMAPLKPNEGQSAGLDSQVDTADPLPLQNTQMDQGMGSASLSTTASASTSACSSPSASFVHPPSHSVAESSSTASTSRSAMKRRRSEDNLDDRAENERQEKSTDAVGLTVWHIFHQLTFQPMQDDLNEGIEPCNNHIPADCTEQPRKKKRPSDDGDFICRICLILGRPCKP